MSVGFGGAFGGSGNYDFGDTSSETGDVSFTTGAFGDSVVGSSSDYLSKSAMIAVAVAVVVALAVAVVVIKKG